MQQHREVFPAPCMQVLMAGPSLIPPIAGSTGDHGYAMTVPIVEQDTYLRLQGLLASPKGCLPQAVLSCRYFPTEESNRAAGASNGEAKQHISTPAGAFSSPALGFELAAHVAQKKAPPRCIYLLPVPSFLPACSLSGHGEDHIGREGYLCVAQVGSQRSRNERPPVARWGSSVLSALSPAHGVWNSSLRSAGTQGPLLRCLCKVR